ncbi:MAG: choice-of-anchor B family protein [Saprospirales bacterium]|nr:choice-of-anchor B family protein [Saprospirales bacterium]
MRSPIFLLLWGALSINAAQAQISSNVTLLVQYHNPSLPISGDTRYNDVWGYVDCEGDEYAILGSAHYVHFFNLANPASPQLVDQFSGGSTTVWRDMKTFRDRAYSVCDNCSEGLMIFDLSNLPASVTKTNQTTQFFSRAHNIYIDEEAGRLYVAGSNTKSNGVIILDLNGDPDNPTQIGNPTLPGGYIHDIFVRANKGYCSHGTNGYWVYNFANPQNPVLLGTLTDYPQEGYNHSSWLTDNGQHVVMADETHNKGLKIVDVSDLSDMTVTDVFRSALLAPADTASIAHNPFIRDNYVFISYYHDGMQVFNISNPNNAVKVAWYDTYPANTNYSGFKGCWGVYPFLPSGKILASDMTNGLFIFSLNNITLDPIPYPSYPTPTISLQGGNPICEGQTVTLNAHPSATDAEWFFNGNPLPDQGTSIQVGEDGVYSAILYNGHCGIQSNSINLDVIPHPNPALTPLGNTTICQGQSVFLSVDPTATAVHWYRNGSLYQIGGYLLQVQQAGTYHAILFNQICPIQTNSVIVQVIPYPSPNITLTGNPVICQGETVTLNVSPSATMVHWFRNGALHQVGGSQLVVGQSGLYYALVFNQNCSVQTAAYNIVVLPLPNPEITPLGDPVLCEGESIYLSANPTNATTVHWYRNGVLHQVGGFLIEVDEAGAYSAILFNQFCPIGSNTVVVEVVPFPDPDIVVSGETSICEWGSVMLSADPTAGSISWYLDGQSLNWEEPQIVAQVEGTYFAVLSNQDCTIQTELVEIEVTPFPDTQIAIQGGPSICEGESVTLSVDPSATSVEWYLDGELLVGEEALQIEVHTGGTYSAILSNQDCTIESEQVVIEVIPFPIRKSLLSGESSICEGESVLAKR